MAQAELSLACFLLVSVSSFLASMMLLFHFGVMLLAPRLTAAEDHCGGCAADRMCVSTPDFEHSECVSCDGDRFQKECGDWYDEFRMAAAHECKHTLHVDEHADVQYECESKPFCGEMFPSFCEMWREGQEHLFDMLGEHCLRLCPPHADYESSIEALKDWDHTEEL